jgi:hypothetical protein
VENDAHDLSLPWVVDVLQRGRCVCVNRDS